MKSHALAPAVLMFTLIVAVACGGAAESAIDVPFVYGPELDAFSDVAAKPVDVQRHGTRVLPLIEDEIPMSIELDFKVVSIEQDTLLAAVPKDWQNEADHPGKYWLEDGNGGEDAAYDVRSSCAKNCAESTSDSPRDDPFRMYKGRGFTITKDETLSKPRGRVMVATDRARTYLIVTRFKKSAEQYYRCTADFSDSHAGLLPTFEAACTTNAPLFLR